MNKTGPTANYLEVGIDPRTFEVIVNHPNLDPDENGVGHIVFSGDQARRLSRLLWDKAEEADDDRLGLLFDRDKVIAAYPDQKVEAIAFRGEWFVVDSSAPMVLLSDALGVGITEYEAWADAARRRPKSWKQS